MDVRSCIAIANVRIKKIRFSCKICIVVSMLEYTCVVQVVQTYLQSNGYK